VRPDRIGRYVVERTLGVGGMGAVYLARDEVLQRPVAIKGLLGRDTSPDRRTRLRREALATAALSHPGIAHVYEIVTEDERDWLVMEYVEGRTLADLVENGALPPGEVARIGAAVARALAAAHARGIVHRDVKADNVILTAHGDVRVLDFGLALRTAPDAAASDRLTGEGMVVGTAKSMSPEQALGRATDHRSDLFSLGSMLFELATGQPAFAGPGPMEIMVKVARNERPALRKLAPRLPQSLVAAIERCMATDPAQRFPDADAAAAALEALVDPTGLTRAVASPSGLARILAPLCRRWWIAAATAVALPALALVAVSRGWLSGSPPLTVAVLPVEVEGDAGELRLASAAVADALAHHLSRLEGLIVVSGREVRSACSDGRPLATIATELGVEEFVRASLVAGDGDRVEVRLARVAGASGGESWSERLELATADLVLIQDRVATALDDAYRELPPTGDRRAAAVNPHALELYLEARSRLESGTPSRGYTEEIRLLDRALELSPGLLRAALDLVSIHRYLMNREEYVAHYERARTILEAALETSPDDPDALVQAVTFARSSGDAATALSRARRLVAARPGSDAAWRALAETLKETGGLAEAERAYSRAWALRPSWAALLGLADARMLRGNYAGAREALDELARRSADNLYGLRKRGEVEMNAGNFAACEAITRAVHARTGSAWDLVNIGNCVFFQGRFADAEELYAEAAAALPHDPLPVANLADARLYGEGAAAARDVYARALEVCENRLAGQTRRWGLLRIKARCLANLGRSREATAVINEELARYPDNPEAVFVAALVAALAGDRSSCLSWTQRALALAAPPIWFGGPEFAALRADREFRRLFPGARPPELTPVRGDPAGH